MPAGGRFRRSRRARDLPPAGASVLGNAGRGGTAFFPSEGGAEYRTDLWASSFLCDVFPGQRTLGRGVGDAGSRRCFPRRGTADSLYQRHQCLPGLPGLCRGDGFHGDMPYPGRGLWTVRYPRPQFFRLLRRAGRRHPEPFLSGYDAELRRGFGGGSHAGHQPRDRPVPELSGLCRDRQVRRNSVRPVQPDRIPPPAGRRRHGGPGGRLQPRLALVGRAVIQGRYRDVPPHPRPRRFPTA